MPQPVAEAIEPPPVVARQRLVVRVEVGDIRERRIEPQLAGLADAGASGELKLAEIAQNASCCSSVSRWSRNTSTA